MKIFGLIDAKKLFILRNEEANLENVLIFSYKLSELGNDGIVLINFDRNTLNKVKKLLQEKLDVKVFEINDLDSVVSVSEYLNGKKGKILLIDGNELLLQFNERVDNLPQLISLITYKAKKDGFETVVTDDIESANISIRFP